MKCYAVKKGHITGIFDSWAECQKATKGFSNPEFKAFNSVDEAEAYMQGIDIWTEKVANDCKNGYLVAFTDGSYDDTYKRYSYGVILTAPGGTESEIYGYGSNSKFVGANNIIGEIFAVINALDWAISNSYTKIKIYHDYEGISKWITGEWKANSDASKIYVNLYRLKYDDLIEVKFEKVAGHSNISYNERADQLARAALVDRKRMAVKGENWYSIPYFSQNDFDAFSSIVIESDNSIFFQKKDLPGKHIYRFNMGRESVTVTLFEGG